MLGPHLFRSVGAWLKSLRVHATLPTRIPTHPTSPERVSRSTMRQGPQLKRHPRDDRACESGWEPRSWWCS